MAVTTPPDKTAEPKPPVKDLPTPPAEEFWQKYSPHYEFPLSNLASIAIHIVVIGIFLYYISRLLNQPSDKTAPPTRGMMVLENDSGDGIGSPGSGGGSERPEAIESDPKRKNERPLPDVELQKAIVSVSNWAPELQEKPDALAAIADSPNRDKINALNEGLRRRLLGLNEKPGGGKEPGTGKTNQPGPGDGGAGNAQSSARRGARWILVFRTENGEDYVRQLGSLNAQLYFPKPNGNYLHFPNLQDLQDRKEVTEQQIPNNMMSFIDDKRDSVDRVVDALRLEFKPKFFLALVPKEVEEDLAAKERNYRNREEEQIHSTTFRVLVRDGKYSVTVTDQVSKRK